MHFRVVIRVVKKRQFCVVNTVAKTEQLWVVTVMVVKKGQY